MYFVYVLKSFQKKIFYIGSCTDVERRLIQHNNGGTKSTKPYRPWQIIYTERHETKTEACKREWHLKHPPGYLEKRAILEQYGANK